MLVSAGSISTTATSLVRELARERLDVVELDDPRGLGEIDRRADVARPRDDAPVRVRGRANDSSTLPW